MGLLNTLKTMAAGLILCLGFGANANAAICSGEFFNPLTDVDMNNMFPISIVGIEVDGPGTRPPLHYVPPVCVCPGLLGIPSVGLGYTFWEPGNLMEAAKPGCMHSLGGLNVAPNFAPLHGEYTNSEGDTGQSTSRPQIHEFKYPLFYILDLLESFGCFNIDGYDLVGFSEIEITHQDDTWNTMTITPDAPLYANVLMQMAAIPDSLASQVGYPIDALYWTYGSWCAATPLSGNVGNTSSYFQLSNCLMAKRIGVKHRLTLSQQTIGPSAICFTHPNPIMIKSQYRYNQVGPIARSGVPVTTGNAGALQWPPVANLPSKEHTVNLIWQAKQCCKRAY